MRYVSVFSGVEAATVAWEPLGWEPVAFCEVDAFPSAVLAERFPDVPNLGDITQVDWERFKSDHGTVDLVVGGSPCQSFSVAGKREGLSGESGLMWEYVRAVRELRPRWFVWENVPGALSSEGGEAFRCLLASMDELGYQCAWRVLDAQFFGVAQRRRRVFLVGSLGDGLAAEVLFEPDGLRWDFEASRDKRKALASRAEGGPGGSRTLQVRCGCAGGGKGALIQEDVSATLSCSNVQTLFQPSYGFSAGQGAKAGSIAFQEEQSPTLRAGASGTNQVPSVLQPTYGFSWHMGAKAGNIGCESEQSPTLTNGGKPPAVAFAANQRGEFRLQGGDGDVFGALPCSWSAKQVQAVAVQSTVVIDRAAYNQGVNAQYPPPHRAGGRDGHLGGQGAARGRVPGGGLLMGRYVVRKLTPRECERLNGFPDDWTRIPWRGKPEEDCPDAPRYKAMGNSMAVTVMRWIGERIQSVESNM